MKTYIDPVIKARIQHAWNQLRPEQRTLLQPLVEGSRMAMKAIQARGLPPPSDFPREALLLHAALTNDGDNALASLESGIVFGVDGIGEIIGTGKYEQLDPGWAECLAEWLEHFITGIHKFSTSPAIVPIPERVMLAVAGDWGTGKWRNQWNPAPSESVGQQIKKLNPEVTIHLGDVYYSGTGPEEQHFLRDLWPTGSLYSFALNSNHEMYAGAKPYFEAISSPPFERQNGCSYFALENENWVIVGLDSAYYSDREGLYRHGAIFSSTGQKYQLDFLQQQVAKGKKVIVLTHHQGLAPDASSTTGLCDQVLSAFPGGEGPAYWYWGHVHVGAVYEPQANMRCRCCGHGGLPWGQAPDLKHPGVVWYENRCANDPDITERVFNGFAVLTLSGANFKEVFYDENGGIAWHEPIPFD
jgi:hypothetical protein